LFSIGLVSIALLVGPALIEQIRTSAAAMPETYATLRLRLQTSAPGPFQLIGHRLPTFERSTDALIAELSRGVVGITTSVVHLFAYFVTVLAVAFYWTMEVPRFERLTLSLLPVGRRANVLNVWHEIESKLGAYLRAQGLAMLSIGVASAIGYTLIGLPNVLALGFLAGLLEAVPLIGPTLASGPAVIVALPLGLRTVLLVIGFSVVVQVTENNVLIPRIMHRAVGVSALVGIFAVLAFGTLYGLLGVFIAIPMTAVIQVLLESMVVDTDPAAAEDAALNPWAGLRARIRALRQQERNRLRARGSRMGIDPATADHVADAVDQQIEKAGVQVERIISAAEETSEPLVSRQGTGRNRRQAGGRDGRRRARRGASGNGHRSKRGLAGTPRRPGASRATLRGRGTRCIHEGRLSGESPPGTARGERRIEPCCQLPNGLLLGRARLAIELECHRSAGPPCTALPQERSARPVHRP
jgi:predicted PurR-regulated permease PerM